MLLVSMSPRCRALCAKKFALLRLMVGVSATKFALRAQNGPNSAFLCLLGEFFAEMPVEGRCWASYFAPTGAVPRTCRRCGALQAAAMGVLRHAEPSCGVSSACRSLGWRYFPRLVAVNSQFVVVSWPNCRPIGGKESKMALLAEWVCDLAESIAIVAHCSRVTPPEDVPQSLVAHSPACRGINRLTSCESCYRTVAI